MSTQPTSPVRKVPIGTRSVTGTMPGGAKFESTLERDLMYLLRFDPAVDNYVAQPIKVEFMDKTGHDRSYTPDVLIHYNNGMPSILVEVKYRDDLWKDFKELRPKLKAAIRYAKERGWRFKIFTEKEIRTPFLANAKFLLAYRDVEQYSESQMVQEVLSYLHNHRESGIEDLLHSLSKDKQQQLELLPVVWHLVATQQIGCDLSIPIAMTSKVWGLKY